MATPSQLSPIKKLTDHSAVDDNVYTDCTLELDESLQFQHYSVDASACFKEDSKCDTLAYSGVELSRAGNLYSVSRGNTAWRHRPKDSKLERMRQFIQSTPLFAQHARSRINEAKFTGSNSQNGETFPCLTRLKFDKETESDVKSPANACEESQTNPEGLSLLASPIAPIENDSKVVCDSPTTCGSSSPDHQGDSGHCTDASASDKASTGSSPKHELTSAGASKTSPRSDKLVSHPSMDSVDLKETALLRDTNTL